MLRAPIACCAALAASAHVAIAIFPSRRAAVLGFLRRDERIWLFLAPFVCLAAAEWDTPLRPLLAALAVQAAVYEVLFETVW